MDELTAHLFPGDDDEHGAVIAASVVRTPRGTRFLAHQLFLARDGVDYVAGERGYRMLTATFVMDCVLKCAELGMAYFAIHCHGGGGHVGFSRDDLASHERGYRALLDILDGQPAGALVFAEDAVAADIWFPSGERGQLAEFVVTARPIRRLYSEPPARPAAADERYDRQSRLFGDRGQDLLKRQKVGVIGAGGIGSLVVEYLARVGVGELVVVDPDRIEKSNVSRVVGSRLRDARPWLTHPRVPQPLRQSFEQFRTLKVSVARRVAKLANRRLHFKCVPSDVVTSAAEQLVDCDYIFLAADSMQARLVFNALVHQYLIPGVQIGAKAQVDEESGDLVDLFVVVRPVGPGEGCLWCNGLIPPGKLQEEATDPVQRRRQRYIDDEDIPAPSVITLNAIAASHAANDYLMAVTALLETRGWSWLRFDPRTKELFHELPRKDATCRECSAHGRLGRGATMRLPIKMK